MGINSTKKGVAALMSTMQDIFALPAGERAELIDGKIYTSATPNRRHQRIVAGVFYTIYSHMKAHEGEGEVNVAPFSVYLFNDDATYVEPDVCVVCDKEKLDEKGCHGAPDLVIEVIAPATRSRDYLLKMIKYKDAGVREYWIIDSERSDVLVYRFEKEEVGHYGFTDQIETGVCQGLVVNFSEMDI